MGFLVGVKGCIVFGGTTIEHRKVRVAIGLEAGLGGNDNVMLHVVKS